MIKRLKGTILAAKKDDASTSGTALRISGTVEP